ncbi:MAG: hypothetical protein ABIH23_31255 [bacterium]
MEKIFDNIGLVIILLVFVANAVVSMIQKAKAEEKRRRRLPGQPQQTAEVTRAESRPVARQQRPQARQMVRKEPARPVKTGPKPSSWPQDVIREWTKQLEQILQPEEEKPTPAAQPALTKAPAPEDRPKPLQKVDARDPQRKRPRRLGVAKQTKSMAFLGRLHRNPIVNGIILSEILSRPVSLREDKSSFIQ